MTENAFEKAMESLQDALNHETSRDRLITLFAQTLSSAETVDDAFEVWETDKSPLKRALLPIETFFNHAIHLMKTEEEFFRLLSFQKRYRKFVDDIPIYEKYLKRLEDENLVIQLFNLAYDDNNHPKETVGDVLRLGKLLNMIFKRLEDLCDAKQQSKTRA